MRVSFNSSYDRFLTTNSNTQEGLNEITKQLSSGKKIQFGDESPSIYIDTLRLDYEITTFQQIKDVSNKAKSFSDYTDSTLNEFTKTLESFKTTMLKASNDIHSLESQEALTKELKSLKEHLMNLSNTSINGQYLFSGSLLNTKPVNSDGSYNGNDKSLNALIGSNVELPYNIDGEELLFGYDRDFKREITTNISHYNKTSLHPDVMSELNKLDNPEELFITGSDTIRDLVGDNDDIDSNQSPTTFYIRGKNSNGEGFKEKFNLNPTDTVDDLLQKIEETYGNTSTVKKVDATLNEWGEIEIVDRESGRNMIDFHMVAATDLSGANNSDVDDISTLNGLTIDEAIDSVGGDLADYNGVLITSFIKSGDDAKLSDLSIDTQGISYDKTVFKKDNSYLKSNVSQIVIDSNEFANSTTKISEVSGDLTNLNTNFTIVGQTVNSDAINANIDLGTLAGDTPTGDVNDVTYQQLLNEITKALAGEADIEVARESVEVKLDNRGRVIVRDLTNVSPTNMEFGIYDSTTDNFANNSNSTLTFNANNALVVDEPSSNFFAQLDMAIESVEYGIYRADGSDEDIPSRNIGIQNSVKSLEHLMKHIENIHTTVGSQNRSLSLSLQRQETMIVNAKTLRSEVLDTDVAEASLKLNQLTLNYQAMMSTISKINSLSLVNYMK